MKRTHLPLNALRVFDAAARHLSFTKAADELAVTPAAVGQQIRALEDVLGVVLFKRMTRNLELTPEAERGLPALRAGFLQFEEAVRLMQEGQGSNTLTVAAPRDFTAKWLAARLAGYGADKPDLRFVLVSADGAVDFTQANLDLAVIFGAMPAEEELSGTRLTTEAMVVVAAPALAERLKSASDLAAAALVHHPGSDWAGWFAERQASHPQADAGLSVGDAGLAIDAAAAGYGVARVPMTLAASDMASGRVARVFDIEPADEAYWLVAPPPQWRQKKVRALVEFLTA
ncbi:LysR substrate-binding domain-containing protein [Sphingoaurantiacus capsulatus]|uniref:LysR substrate-binding domain-containing protein n=1 Tax=Sphingoaurantiacus capsulatus TaxID=1771310 RepID=A0ABV7XEU1_9SPHN